MIVYELGAGMKPEDLHSSTEYLNIHSFGVCNTSLYLYLSFIILILLHIVIKAFEKCIEIVLNDATNIHYSIRHVCNDMLGL